MQAKPTDQHLKQAQAAARDEALRDVDSFADWLCGMCYAAPVQPMRVALRDKTAEDFAAMPVPALLALLLDAGQPASTTMAARDALATRYCDTATVAKWIESEAEARSGEIAEQEKLDLREVTA